MLAEGLSDPEEIDTLWGKMFADPRMGPCAMLNAEGLEQIAEADDEDIRDLTLDSTVASDYLRKKYIQQGRGGTENVKDGFGSRRSCNAVANGHLYPPKTSDQPTLFFLDVGVGENVSSIEEAMTAGKSCPPTRVASRSKCSYVANPTRMESTSASKLDVFSGPIWA